MNKKRIREHYAKIEEERKKKRNKKIFIGISIFIGSIIFMLLSFVIFMSIFASPAGGTV